VPNTGRLTVRDSTILGQRIPKGTMVVISPWAINRSTKLWGPDAEKYIPERWIGNDKEPQYGGTKSGFSLITFLHGARGCIGQSFSRLELKCLVMAMVMRFEIEMADPTEEIVPGGFITIKPKDGMRLRLREIKV
jgi:cytochrome P450